jgi:hypothetical protein
MKNITNSELFGNVSLFYRTSKCHLDMNMYHIHVIYVIWGMMVIDIALDWCEFFSRQQLYFLNDKKLKIIATLLSSSNKDSSHVSARHQTGNIMNRINHFGQQMNIIYIYIYLN